MRFANVALDGVSGTVITGQAGRRIVVFKMVLAPEDTVSFHLRSGVSGTFHAGDSTTPGQIQMIRGYQFRLPGDAPWFQCDVGADLRLVLEGAGIGFAGVIVYQFSDKDLETL